MLHRHTSRIARLVEFLVPDPRVERRRRRRLQTDVDVILSGNSGQTTARGVDLNRGGMGVQANQPVSVGTLLFVRLPECGLMGFAFVRRCDTRDDGLYLIGLEFREPLTRDRSDAAPRPDGGSWQVRVTRGTCRSWSAADDV
jgi:PilZ domain